MKFFTLMQEHVCNTTVEKKMGVTELNFLENAF
jgi:hypothetical protein